MYQSTYRRRNIGPITRYGRFNSRSYHTRRFHRGRYGYAYPTHFRYGASRRTAHIGASRGFAGYHLTNKEKKYLNTSLTAAGPASYPIVNTPQDNTNVIGLNLLAEGTDYTNRISRKVHVTSIQLRGQITIGTAATSTMVRFMVVYDYQPNGAVPAITDILDTATSSTQPIAAPMNLNNRDRFRVVIDKIRKVDTLQSSRIPFNFYKNCNYETVYNAAGAGVATVTSGALWFFAVSAINAVGTFPYLGYNVGGGAQSDAVCRIRFVDG